MELYNGHTRAMPYVAPRGLHSSSHGIRPLERYTYNTTSEPLLCCRESAVSSFMLGVCAVLLLLDSTSIIRCFSTLSLSFPPKIRQTTVSSAWNTSWDRHEPSWDHHELQTQDGRAQIPVQHNKSMSSTCRLFRMTSLLASHVAQCRGASRALHRFRLSLGPVSAPPTPPRSSPAAAWFQ